MGTIRTLPLMLLGAFACSSSPTNDRVPSSPTPKVQIKVEPFRWLRLPSPTHIDEMIAMIESINEWVHPHLQIPESLTLQATEVFGNAYYEHDPPTLLLPYQMRFEHHTKHPKFTRGVWAHEYGHALLAHNLERLAPRFSKAYKDVLKRSEAIEARRSTVLRNIESRSPNETPAQKARRAEQIAEIQAGFSKVERNVLDELSRVEDLQGTHDELFADLVAVIETDDPQAMEDALYMAYFENKADREAPMTRAFDRVRRPENWKHTDAHSGLSPTRSWLWKYCLSGPRMRLLKRGEKQGDFLRIVLETMSASMEDYVDDVRRGTLDVTLLNKTLTKNLDRALGRYCHN